MASFNGEVDSVFSQMILVRVASVSLTLPWRKAESDSCLWPLIFMAASDLVCQFFMTRQRLTMGLSLEASMVNDILGEVAVSR